MVLFKDIVKGRPQSSWTDEITKKMCTVMWMRVAQIAAADWWLNDLYNIIRTIGREVQNQSYLPLVRSARAPSGHPTESPSTSTGSSSSQRGAELDSSYGKLSACRLRHFRRRRRCLFAFTLWYVWKCKGCLNINERASKYYIFPIFQYWKRIFKNMSTDSDNRTARWSIYVTVFNDYLSAMRQVKVSLVAW